MLRIGTDCSGIEAPIQALRQLNIPHKHEFSSDIDKFCVKSIKANYSPAIIFGDKDGKYPEGDIRKRDISAVPDIDLYICGFPCQPFSNAGDKKGLNDDRGNVFWSCLNIIYNKKPKYFILENVKAILHHDKGKTWKIIEKELNELKIFGYFVDWKVLNTKDYGIPQNRNRLFIIGSVDSKIIWPDKVKSKTLESYIDWKDTRKQQIPECSKNLLNIVPENSIFIDLSYPNYKHPNANKCCPTITCSNRLWNIPLSRYTNINERLKMQGFSSFEQVVSNTQLHKQIGNSMSVNVIKKLLQLLLKTS